MNGLDHDAASSRDKRVHEVTITEASRLASALGACALTVNSFHHQALARVPSAFRIVAKSPDGVIEGVESTEPGWWMLGVQWHPEELTETAEPWDRSLFAAFANACRGT